MVDDVFCEGLRQTDWVTCDCGQGPVRFFKAYRGWVMVLHWDTHRSKDQLAMCVHESIDFLNL